METAGSNTLKINTKAENVASTPFESWVALILLWLVYAMNANSRQMIFSVLPPVIKEFNLTPTSIGLYAAIITMSTSLLAIPIMLWVDKGGQGWRRKYRHLPIVVGYTLFTFLTGVNVLTVSIGMLIATQILSHAIGGVGETIEVTSLSEWWSRERRGLALGLHHTGYPWGTFIGGFAISGILGAYGPENWRLAFLLFPVPMIVIFGAYWWFATQKRYQRFVDHIALVGETPPEQSEQTARVSAPEGTLKSVFLNPNVSVISLISLLGIVGYFGISFWLPQYLAFVAHYNFAEAAAYSVLFTITGGVGQIAWGWLSDRVGRKFCLMIIFIWLTFSMFLFEYTSVSLGVLVAIQLFAGFAMNAPYTLVYAIALDSTKPGTTGTAASMVNVGIYLGGFGPLLIGGMIESGGGFGNVSGYNGALYFIAGLMFAAFVITALFTRETAGWFRKWDWALVSRKACNVD